MRVRVNYYDRTKRDNSIVTLTTVECSSVYSKGILSVHNKGILIESIHALIGEALIVYVTGIPTRIDKQGDTIFLVDAESAKSHPEPYFLCEDTKLFGKPETVWLDERREPAGTRETHKEKL